MGFFLPGIAIANRFSFGTKFLGIGAIFVLALLYSGIQILSATSSDIKKLKLEHAGIELQESFQKILYANQQTG